MHRNKHSYSSNKDETENMCNKCDCESSTIETMEVHIGKQKVQYYECGLCDFKFEELDRLNTNLFSCEIYECGECYYRHKNLREVKEHVRNGHKTNKLHNLKLDREGENKVSFKNYFIWKL